MNTVSKPFNWNHTDDKGCLSMTRDQYLKLLDWTGRQIRIDKTGRIPDECAPILERLNAVPKRGWIS